MHSMHALTMLFPPPPWADQLHIIEKDRFLRKGVRGKKGQVGDTFNEIDYYKVLLQVSLHRGLY